MILLVLGGDNRQRYLAKLLEEDGHTVLLWGLGQKQEAALECAGIADCVILPLPVSRDGIHLHLPLTSETLTLEELWTVLGKGIVCGGSVSEPMRAAAKEHGVELLDYFDWEEVQVENAVSTAEGALQTAMAAMDTTIHGAHSLVLGHGRIGKILAHHLRALGAQVTVAARRRSERSWAEAFGCRACSMEELDQVLGSCELIFNTVPSPLLRSVQLKQLRPTCLVIELASVPGGVDLAAAETLGLRVITARGLPGKAAPLSAAAVLRDSIYHILKERGEPI